MTAHRPPTTLDQLGLHLGPLAGHRRHDDVARLAPPARFLRLRNAMMVSGAIGLIVFASYPVAPPRLRGLGLVDTVTSSSTAYRVLQPPAFVNQYAAMPSLHSGWDLLVGIAIVTAATTCGCGASGPDAGAHGAGRRRHRATTTSSTWSRAVALALSSEHRRCARVAGLERLAAQPAPAAVRRTCTDDRPSPSLTAPGTRWPGCRGHRARCRRRSSATSTTYRGRLEVRHLKTAGPLPFLWDRWELASASAPRLGLAELLEADRHGTTFMLDLKGRRTAAPLGRSPDCCTSSVTTDRSWCAAATGRRWRCWPGSPFVRPVLSARNRAELAPAAARVQPRRPVHGVSVHRTLLDDALVAELHEPGGGGDDLAGQRLRGAGHVLAWVSTAVISDETAGAPGAARPRG